MTSTHRPSTPGPRIIIPVLTAGAAVTFATGLLTGLFSPPDLADPGPITRWALPVLTYAQKIVAALTFGAFLLAATVYSPGRSGQRGPLSYDRPEWHRAIRAGRYSALAWPIIEILLLVVTYSSVAAVPLTDDGFGPGLWQFITEIELGQKLLWSFIFATLTSLVAVGVRTLAGAAWAAALAAITQVPVALTGHAAGASSHTLAVSSAYLHLIGVGAWVGALLVLLATAPTDRERLATYVSRYSQIAGWSLLAVAYSGAAASWIRFNSVTEFVTTDYGRILSLKLAATAALGLAGLAHRRRLIARIHDTPRPFLRLALGEVGVMAGVIGLAAVLRNTAPPIPQTPVPDASPTFLLSQYPTPPYPDLYRYVTEWRLEPLLALGTFAAAYCYVTWVRRLTDRGDHWPVGRTISWMIGLVIFAWVTSGGPTVYGAVLFSAHMFMHMMLAMVIPIFLVLGAPVTLMARAVPARTDGSRGGREILLAVAHSRYGAFWSHPVVAGLNFSGSLIIFYFTGLFELALTTHVGHLLMIVHFTLAGYMFANALIGIDPGPRRPSYALRLVVLFATMGFHAFFGIAVISSTSVLANEYFGWLGLPWGVDALADQEIGGAITWGIGEFPTLALAIAVAISWMIADRKTARRLDRQADRDDDAELKAYNEMLAARANLRP